MYRSKKITFVILVVCIGFILPLVFAQDAKQSERKAMYYRYLNLASLVKGGSIQPHWMADEGRFWYAEGAPENTIIYKVDPKANTKETLFNTSRLREALTAVLGHELPYKGLPFYTFAFVPGQRAVKFSVEGRNFICQLDTYKITQIPAPSQEERSRMIPQIVRKGFPTGRPDVMEILSPDRRWFLGAKNHNLYLRSTYDGRIEPLTTDGIKDYEWMMQLRELRILERAKWSPDSYKVAAPKVDSRKVGRLPIVHWLKQTVEVEWIPYVRGGRAMPQEELYILDILSKKQIRIDTGDKPDQYLGILGWRPDGSELIVGRMDREKKKVELMAADPSTGSTRIILTETQKTFVEGLSPPVYAGLKFLEDGKRFIWKSERNGWAHLYLYDLNGNLINRLTKGTFPVLNIVAVDEKSGWVYFTAHAEERLYDTQLYRVNFEGKRFQRLTEAIGQHIIQFSPSKEFFLDVHSSSDRPPSTELRKADGTLLQTLSKANIEGLKDLRWSPPEEFVVKAADGETDLYGIMYKPYDFDPSKKYPVIDFIYGGPQIVFVPHRFMWTGPRGSVFSMGQAMAQLGFIVFTVDARGTPEREKAFQDVVYGNIGRNEIPDHVATLKQLAAERPYMDLSKVGVFGISYGGYFTIRAMLLAPDVYHVGVSTAPVTDLYPRNAPVEPYMGLPQNNLAGYEYGSSLRLASKLKGKLLLIHGTSDINATFDATMKLVEAFIRAGKQFDLLVMPGQDHNFNGWDGKGFIYWLDAVPRYFLEHLSPDK